MNALKTLQLHSVALHCGYPTATTKATRLAAIGSYDAFYSRLAAKPLDIISVDVGIKNFSYCKASYPSLDLPKVQIVQWNHLNLHDKFGALYTAKTSDPTSLVNSTAYLAHLAVHVVDLVFNSPKWVPSVVTIENQRTRSNGNSATLPNVLLNFTLENMLYAACAARATPKFNPDVLPMNANKMVNFWIARFTAKGPRLSGAQSKALRTQLLYGWLSQPANAPFKMDIGPLLGDFGSLSNRAKTNALLDALSFDSRPKKVDDLVDCLLYNLMYVLRLRHHCQLKTAIENENDLGELLHQWNTEHCAYLQPLVDAGAIELDTEYVEQ